MISIKTVWFVVILLAVFVVAFWWSYAVNAPNSVPATATSPAIPAPSIKIL